VKQEETIMTAATTQNTRPPRPTCASIEVNVVFDDIADVLEEAGWHLKEDCLTLAGKLNTAAGDLRDAQDDKEQLADAIRILHQQAHPVCDVIACQEEPCRSLPVDLMIIPFSNQAPALPEVPGSLQATLDPE
jgi:hypothetical protein